MHEIYYSSHYDAGTRDAMRRLAIFVQRRHLASSSDLSRVVAADRNISILSDIARRRGS